MSPSGSRGRGRGVGGPRTKTTSPYHAEFEQKLMDNGVYPKGHILEHDSQAQEPGNIEDIQAMLSVRRSSLSPSRFPDAVFKDFQKKNDSATAESKMMAEVFPIIYGEKDEQHESTGDIVFTRLKKFNKDLSTPKPDRYYGARPAQIDPRVRRDLNEYIVPSNRTSLPAAPNFFFEGKSAAAGRPEVAQRQAMYDGAIGARSMLHLQNYGNPALTYDGNAYTISSTYHAGTLTIYATHPRESQTHDRTEYHITQIRAYVMNDTSGSFRKGATAYRNARDWAQQQRNRFVANANAVAQNHTANASSSSRNTRAFVDDDDDDDDDEDDEDEDEDEDEDDDDDDDEGEGVVHESDTSIVELAPEYEAKRRIVGK